jgi:peptidoglycan-associated lipoprotein
MTRMLLNSRMIAIIGVLALSSQGCGMKWLQSGGDSESGTAAGGGANSSLPNLSRSGSGSELSGFSHDPSEERLALAQGGFTTSLTPGDAGNRRRAELTREEKAALEAGLQDVFFGYDQWMVSNAGMEALNRDASYLKDHPGAVVKIEGHCDERGTSDYNMVLGDKRAKAARTYLLESGVSPKQVSIVSFGKEHPFCFDPEESCYQQNRRGHMLLTTKK